MHNGPLIPRRRAYIMNFYYFMHLKCPLQETLEPIRFIERVGLASALEHTAADDDALQLKVRLDGAERLMPKSAVRELYNDFLGEARLHCLHCPINRTSNPCGCLGIVPLPLSAASEKWLFDQFTPPEPERSLFLDGGRLARLPARRHERLLASAVEFKKRLGAAEISSTQLFYILLNLRELPYAARLHLLHEFGVLKAKPREIDDLAALIEAAATSGGLLAASQQIGAIRKGLDRIKVKMKFEKSDDDSIRMLKQYFLFCLQSLNAGVPMHASLM